MTDDKIKELAGSVAQEWWDTGRELHEPYTIPAPQRLANITEIVIRAAVAEAEKQLLAELAEAERCAVSEEEWMAATAEQKKRAEKAEAEIERLKAESLRLRHCETCDRTGGETCTGLRCEECYLAAHDEAMAEAARIAVESPYWAGSAIADRILAAIQPLHS